jgi:hypothetical protein
MVNLTPRQDQIRKLIQEGLTQRAIAKKLNLSRGNISGAVLAIKKKYLADQADPGFHVKGKSTMYDRRTGEAIIEWVKTSKEIEDLEEVANDIVKALNPSIPRIKKTLAPRIQPDDKLFMESFCFGDPHINMYAWARETGADWDVDIAVQMHEEGMLDLITSSKPAGMGRFIVLGDLLHNDSLKPNTASLTPVDVDGRLSMAIDEVVKLLRSCITAMLIKFSKVEVILARGNHSPTLELLLSKMLRIAFEKEPRITIIDNTQKHIPLVWGKNFQLITHGDKMNHQRKVDVAVGPFRALHGAATFTHVMSGHLHHTDIKEIGGCQSEIFQVLPTQDAWHTESGFVTADQSAVRIRYHPNGGICDRHYYNPRFFIN